MILQEKICPVCLCSNINHFSVYKFQSILFDIMLCKQCLSLVNQTAYEGLHEKELKKIQYSEIYHLDDWSKENINNGLVMAENLLTSLINDDNQTNEKNFCDFGTGKGFLAHTASKYFKHSCGIDFDLSGPRVLMSMFPTVNLDFYEVLDERCQKFDYVVMWHSLEHLPNPCDSLIKIKNYMNINGKLIVQVPMLKREYMELSHFVFYNKNSLDFLMKSIGLRSIKYLFDYEREFLTGFFVKA
jgi:hypothetical protein